MGVIAVPPGSFNYLTLPSMTPEGGIDFTGCAATKVAGEAEENEIERLQLCWPHPAFYFFIQIIRGSCRGPDPLPDYCG